MNTTFIDAAGNVFQAITAIETPPGATPIPPRPGPFHDLDRSDPDPANWVWVESPTRAVDELATAVLAAETHVDASIATARRFFITDIPGQEMTYQEKKIEAVSFLSQSPEPSDLTPFPYIAAEAAALSVTAVEVANTYATLSAQWSAVGVQLEALRVSSKSKAAAAADLGAVALVLSDFDSALAALLSSL